MKIGYICLDCKKYINIEKGDLKENHADNCGKFNHVSSSSNKFPNIIIPAGWGSREIFDPNTGCMVDDKVIRDKKAKGELLLSNEEIAQESAKNKKRNIEEEIHRSDDSLKEEIMTTLSQRSD